MSLLSLQKKNSYDYVACFIAMWRQCSQKRLRFVKTIRYRLEWVRSAMQRDHSLKVLYLVRDFRATLYSQSATFETFNITVEGESQAKAMCATVEDDAREIQMLSQLFPGRIHVLRYGDGCLHPVNYARNIYAFAGLEFSEAIELFVKSITQSKKSQQVVSDKYKVERTDAVRTMNKWRLSSNFELVQKIDTLCAKADAIFGYKPVSSARQLYSMKFSLVSDPKLSEDLYQSVSSDK
ncbi:carbohydrate sulfotransferase 3-like [Plakobranchus ocellatus]|uniref:Carbohydrate sulfotransferase 3-like n=1 Tax=Plakobranchus ocellatus TaxID=259542 RepID=A0AAV4CFN2_9GAST|nr:carbohydrate sulfotransferase 3-like [Plakobranchus ocellatus]